MRHIINHTGYQITCEAAGYSAEDASELIERRLRGLTPALDANITHMLGIPGSGKSTYVRDLPKRNTAVISFDSIMETLPGYNSDMINRGIETAFANWEPPAREIGYEMLFRAVDRRFNIVMDHSGARPDHLEMLKHLRDEKDYTVSIVAMLVDTDVAIERAAKRTRYLPPAYIPERKKIIDAMLPAYQAVAHDFVAYQSTRDGNVLIEPAWAEVVMPRAAKLSSP
jgi:predicted kinase